MKKSLIYLLIILVLATVLRSYQLDKVPVSLFGDELDVGYQAYSLLKTGQDLRGNSWPVLVQSLSEYRAPLFIYSDIPFIAFFGLNEWGVRLAATFWGVLGILGIYLLARRLFNERIGLFAAGFLTVSPWHVQYSRAGFEVTMLLTFLIFGTYFFLKGLERKYFLIVSAILFSLTPYIYSTAVVFMPILLLLIVLIFKQRLRKSMTILIIGFFVMFLVLMPYAVQTLTGKSGERFAVISIFTNRDLQDKILLAQQSEQLPLNLQKVFYNKPIIWLQNFSLNYLRAFSPEFLFLNGDPNFRQSIHEMGEMYYFEIVFLLVGLWFGIKKLDSTNKLILGWLLIAPIPAALTYDGGFHATRDFLMLLPLMIFVAMGFDKLMLEKKVEIKYLLVALLVVAIFNFGFYLNRYFVRYPIESSRAWQFGFKEAMQFVSETQNQYDRILINNTYEPSLIRFLFWTKYDPSKFHAQFQGDNFDGFSLNNKFLFGKFNGPFEGVVDSRTLFVASARDNITNPDTLKDKRVRLLKTIYSPSYEPIFYLITGN